VLPPALKPVNRHMLIVPHPEKEKSENSGVLLPDDYKPQEDRYITATVVDVAPDCAEYFQRLRRGTFSDKTVVADRAMIEEVKIEGKINYLILENYIIGVLRGIND